MDEDYKGFLELVTSQVAMSISDARAYEDERKRAEGLAEIDRAKTTFFSNVSHEFRTPLTLMLGPLEDLLTGNHTDLAPATKEQLEMVNRNGLRLHRLVNMLLDFSRIEAGRTQAVFEPTDLGALTADLASVFRAATEKAGLRLSVACAKLPGLAYVDRDMWEKIVLNLLSNAFKFTFEGEICIDLRAKGPNAELTVRDTGVGIPAEELPRLFERFHRVENTRSRTHEGSGIGLALVHELIKLHGGTIHAASAVGLGTTFTVTLPLGYEHLPPERLGRTRKSADSKPVIAGSYVEEALRWLPESELSEAGISHSALPVFPTSGLEAPATSGARSRVLVADDNADMRQYISTLLGGRYDVETVADGQMALCAARKRHPDLILSDVMMPHMDGLGLVRELRADPALRTIPIILLSARAGEESEVEGFGQGAEDYLVKPFSARELTARVAARLEMARMRTEAAAKIQQSEERYRTLFNTLIEGFCIIEVIFDADGKPVDYRFLEINPAFEQQTGLQDARGKRIRELAPDHDTHWFEIYGRIALTGEPAQFENEAKALKRWFRVSAFRLGGPESRKVAVLFDDITNRKQAEEALLQSRARYDFIKDAAELGFWRCDLPFAELIWDAQVKEHFWLPPDARVTIDLFYERLHPDDRERTRQAMAESINHRTRYEIEYRTVGPSGAYKWIRAIGRTFYDAAGQPCRFDGLTLDVTERKRAEEALQEAHTLLADKAKHLEMLVQQRTVALRETIGELEAFSYSISHDMRGPLRWMQNFGLILSQDYASRLDEQGQDYLERIVSAAKRMDLLIRDVLTYSQVAKTDLPLVPIDLESLLRDIISSYPIFQRPAAEIEIQGSFPLVLGVHALLTQCISNLLGNAVKFVAPGVTPRVRVFAGPAEKGDMPRIFFEDNGIGIAPEDHQKIFGIFERLSKNYDGTGIGLAIVKKSVEQIGGQVGLNSKPGEGSVFWLELNPAK